MMPTHQARAQRRSSSARRSSAPARHRPCRSRADAQQTSAATLALRTPRRTPTRRRPGQDGNDAACALSAFGAESQIVAKTGTATRTGGGSRSRRGRETLVCASRPGSPPRNKEATTNTLRTRSAVVCRRDRRARHWHRVEAVDHAALEVLGQADPGLGRAEGHRLHEDAGQQEVDVLHPGRQRLHRRRRSGTAART